ncbi:GAF and ANTAR domain-containing protein [Arthrobacter sp. Soc17.1.1.1]|uniref:GAF and ANTAR domain-containing protein n=1 Tax=Arthrobacter sp. Soc17.1.1.1 TaxID=3121277 RepID=UPI002FE4EEDA
MEQGMGGTSAAERLQRLLLTSGTLDIFLEGFASHTVTLLEGQVDVLCGVTLKQQKQALTVASSSPEAKALDEVQYGYGDGPCLNAIRTGTTIIVQDTRTDGRWPEYFDAITAQGFHSVLGVPILTGTGEYTGDSGGSGDRAGKRDSDGIGKRDKSGGKGGGKDSAEGVAVDLYARKPHAFTPELIEQVEAYAAEATLTLQLALRLAAHERTAAHLRAAMESRTNIDIAIGIIIAQNRCTPDTAISILQRASNGQNIKLRVLAEQIVASLASTPAPTHFTD